MPGIVGLISKKPREVAERELAVMVESLRHENFYVTGTWINERLGIYAGWIARQNSFAAKMPVQNENGEITLIFSGEEFPEGGTEARLKNAGHQFASGTAEYLAHIFEEDSSFPASLNGRFQGLVVDQRSGSASLFNDRYGIHPVYIHECNDAFYFAGEAKAILAVRPQLRSLDPQGLGDFLACGAVLENRTLFEQIFKLPPASSWTFQNATLTEKRCYFDPSEWENQEPLESEAYYQELRRIFSQNLPRYFGGSERIGMSLTGGLDTRMVLAGRKIEPRSLPCYTFGSMFRDNHDVRTARQVAAACGQSFEVITAGREFLSNFAKYAERAVYLTDGAVDVSRSPDLYLNEHVRHVAPVRMTGNYGGEVLRAVRAFKPEQQRAGLFQQDVLQQVKNSGQNFARIASKHPVSFAVFQQGPWHHSGILALEQTQVAMRSPFLDNDFVRTVFRSPRSEYASNEVSLRLIRDGNPELAQIPTDRGFAGDCGNVRRALARVFLEFQFKAEYAYDMGMPKWLAVVDHSLAGLHLERLFLGRHKVFHFRIWYRDALASSLREILLDPTSVKRPYVESKSLSAVVNSHLNGTGNYTNELHKLLTLELLHRRLLDRPSAFVNSAQGNAGITALVAK